ncbi:MAG: cation transporter [Deltaproteobacteria bacterium]|nr:cation transporter [Deltaproteobacteria bacterium]
MNLTSYMLRLSCKRMTRSHSDSSDSSDSGSADASPLGHGLDGGHAGHHHATGSCRALLISLVLNAGFLLVEAGVGWWTQSLALLSDAVHMLSDVGALFVAYLAAFLAERAATVARTYGYKRAEVLGAAFNTLFFIGSVRVHRRRSAWAGAAPIGTSP